MTHGDSVNKSKYILIVEKGADPREQKGRIRKEEKQRFKDPEKIYGSRRHVKGARVD